MNYLYGFKKGQSQAYDSAGHRVPVTLVEMSPSMVVGKKTTEKNGYDAFQIALGTKKNLIKPITGLLKNLSEKISPRFIREVKIENLAKETGEKIVASEVFAKGDSVNVAGISVGKGFAGVVKRHGFHGMPKTHGTSDRWRHPGSIGQTTTPGRVYKNKRMAGHMGSEMVTIRNLEIFEINTDNTVLIKGLVPGKVGTLLKITKN